jgi:hypothetical protein
MAAMTMRKYLAVMAAALLAAASARAADAPAASKMEVAEATGDINGDGVPDTVQLLQAADDTDIDLAVTLSTGGKLPDKPTLIKPAFGWSNGMSDAPGLKITPKGSVVIEFRNDQGRGRWRQQFTLAYRSGVLVVAGYAYEGRDALDPDKGAGCDLDLLTGKGTRNLKPVKIAPGGIPVTNWSDDIVPKPCKFDD